MAKPAKAPKKRATTAKKNIKKPVAKTTGLRNPRTLIFAVAFAMVGVFLLFQANAKSTMLANPDEVIAAYYQSRPTMVTNNLATEEVVFESITSGYALLADGTLLCDAGGTADAINTGKVGLGIVKQIHSEIEQLNLNTLPADIAPAGTEVMVSNNEGFILASRDSIKTISVHKDSQKPDKLAKMQDILAKTCEKSATKTQKRGSVKVPKLPRGAKRSAQDHSAISRLATAFSPKVSATATGTGTSPTPAAIYTATIDSVFSNDQFARTNNYRVSNGLPALPKSPCVTNAAHAWAKTMAQTGDFKHNPNLPVDLANHCASAGFKYNADDPAKQDGSNTYTFIGENVGVGPHGQSELMFNAYINSTGHRNHILATGSRCVGHGSYRSSNGKHYHVFVSAAWQGGGACQM